jgi:4-amino-4-deoxy-L-arabinose transferase-like glycosyltransferase
MTFHYFTYNQIIPLIISAVILICSILCFHKGKRRISLGLLFLGAVGLGVFIANLDHFLILWDEQYHALVAKNLSFNPFKPTLYSNPLLAYDYKNWTGNHIWLHKQPLFLWQMALSLKLFGFNEFAVRIPSIILHAVAVMFTYRIGKISATERIGYYGALFFALAYYPLELVAGRGTTDHNDIAFLFYVTASIWAWFEYQHTKNKSYLVLIGLFSGCAVLVKWLVGLLIYAVWLVTIGVNDKQNWLKPKAYKPLIGALLVTILVFVPWQIYILINFPVEANYEFAFNTKHFFESLENHGGTMWFHIKELNTIYGSGYVIPYVYLIGLILFVKSSKSNIYRVAILSAILITYIFYSAAATKMVSFCVIVSPLVFLGLGSFIDSVTSYLASKIKYVKFETIFSPIILITVCIFLLNIPKIQKNHTDWKPLDNCNRAVEIKEMEFIKKLKNRLGNEKYVVFNAANVRIYGHIPIMFYTNYIAYEFIPNEKQIEQIESKKYKIAIYDNDQLPEYITSKNDIVKIKL